MKRSDDARSFICGLIHTSANLRQDPNDDILNVGIHGQANPVHDTIVARLYEERNTTETTYLGSPTAD